MFKCDHDSSMQEVELDKNTVPSRIAQDKWVDQPKKDEGSLIRYDEPFELRTRLCKRPSSVDQYTQPACLSGVSCSLSGSEARLDKEG